MQIRKNKTVIGVLIILIVSVLIFITTLLYNKTEFLNIDKCMDAGGRFNYALKKCEQ